MLQSLMDAFPVPVKSSPSGILDTQKEQNKRRWIHPAHRSDVRKETRTHAEQKHTTALFTVGTFIKRFGVCSFMKFLKACE